MRTKSLSYLVVLLIPLLSASCYGRKIEPLVTLDYEVPLVAYRLTEDNRLITYRHENFEGSFLYFFDLTDPLRPRKIGRWRWARDAKECQVFFYRVYAYKNCGEPHYSFSMVDTSRTFAPQLLFSEEVGAYWQGMAVHEDYLFTIEVEGWKSAAGATSTVEVWQVVEFDHLQLLAALVVPVGIGIFWEDSNRPIVVDGNYLLFTSSDSPHADNYPQDTVIVVIDISDPRKPLLVNMFDGGRSPTSTSYFATELSGDYLYSSQVTLRIVDLSALPELTTIGLEGGRAITDIAFSNSIVYGVGYSSLSVIDVSDVSLPFHVAHDLKRADNVAVLGDYVYAVEGIYDQTRIYEKWDPSVPRSPPMVVPTSTPVPFSCANIVESHWREFRFGVDSPYGVAAKATRLWGLDGSEITIGESRRWPFVRWADIRGVYEASFPRERKLSGVRHDFRSDPTLSQFIDCLGPPEYYLAYYVGRVGSVHLIVHLWYAKRGIVVTHDSFHQQRQLPSILPSLRMSGYGVVAPGPLEQMATDVYPHGLYRADEYRALCLAKAWPGAIEFMEADSLLGEDPPCQQP